MSIKNSVCNECIKGDVCCRKEIVQEYESKLSMKTLKLKIVGNTLKDSVNTTPSYDLQNNGINFKVTCNTFVQAPKPVKHHYNE
jgi:hypothetical protein